MANKISASPTALCMTHALDIAQGLSGGNDLAVASLLGNMGIVHESCGEYAAALDCFNKELGIELAEYIQVHQNVLAVVAYCIQFELLFR